LYSEDKAGTLLRTLPGTDVYTSIACGIACAVVKEKVESEGREGSENLFG